MNRRTWTGWVLLGTLVLAAAGALALVNALTGEHSAETPLALARADMMVLFPDADPNGNGFEDIALPEGSVLNYACQVRKGETLLGYGVATTLQGYAGPVQVTAGFTPDRKLRGIMVGGDAFAETEGLGSQAKDESFRDQFRDKMPPLRLGQEIQAISGATITSRAVVNGVNQAAEALWQIVGTPQAAQSSQTAGASVMGYAGPVLVQIALDEAGTITALQVGKARFLETEGVGSQVKELAFTSQFIGKKPPLALGTDIDAISGATLSSQAVVDAVNAAMAFLNE